MGQYLSAPDDVERVHKDASKDQVCVLRKSLSLGYCDWFVIPEGMLDSTLRKEAVRLKRIPEYNLVFARS